MTAQGRRKIAAATNLANTIRGARQSRANRDYRTSQANVASEKEEYRRGRLEQGDVLAAEEKTYQRNREETPTAMMKQLVKQSFQAVDEFGEDSQEALQVQKKINLLGPMIKNMKLTMRDYQQTYGEDALRATQAAKLIKIPGNLLGADIKPPPEKPFFAGARKSIKDMVGFDAKSQADSDYASELSEWESNTERVLRAAITKHEPNIHEPGIRQFIRGKISILKRMSGADEEDRLDIEKEDITYSVTTGKVATRGGRSTLSGRISGRENRQTTDRGKKEENKFKPSETEMKAFKKKYPKVPKKQAIEAIMAAKKANAAKKKK